MASPAPDPSASRLGDTTRRVRPLRVALALLAGAAAVSGVAGPVGAERGRTGGTIQCSFGGEERSGVATSVGVECRALAPAMGDAAGGGPAGSDEAVPTLNCAAQPMTPGQVREFFERGRSEPPIVYDGDVWVGAVCASSPTGRVGLVAVHRLSSAGPDISALVAEAGAALELPVPETRLLVPAGGHPVGAPLGLAINPAGYQVISSRAEDRGAAVVVTARPTAVVWDPGDGSELFACTGPGSARSAGSAGSSGMGPLAAGDAPACHHLYRWASASADNPGGSFTVRATITWERSWLCQPSCGSGDLPPGVQSTTVTVVVVSSAVDPATG
jgi:hypothetical protein